MANTRRLRRPERIGTLERVMREVPMTQAQLASFLGVNDRTIRRWRDGETVIPAGFNFLLDSVLSGAVMVPDDYRKARGAE